MTKKNLRKGSKCEVVVLQPGKIAKVVAHGRDEWGSYVEVRFENGTTERYHPENVKPARVRS